MAERHWLAAACVPQDSVRAIRLRWASRVVRVGHWSVATTLRTLTAVRDGGTAAEPGEGWPDATGVALIARLTGCPVPADAVAVDAADLLRWCHYPAAPPCPHCGGKGWETETVHQYVPEGYPQRPAEGGLEVQCWQCDGDGKDVRRSAGRVCGAMVDKDLILAALPGPLAEAFCRAWRGPVAEVNLIGGELPHALFLSGETVEGVEWRAVVYELSPESSDADHDPLGTRYAPTYVPGIGALWHLIDAGGRYIVSDWLMDRGLDIEQVDPIPF